MAHLYISAAHRSSGKTTLSIGLCAALQGRGLQVRPFKKGPDYIDPLWLSAAAGYPCLNLDFHTMGRDEILDGFGRALGSGDIGLIEGNKGLYDGMDLEGTDSNAAMAKLLAAPVVLILDTRGMTRGVAPLLQGYQRFDTEVAIVGVILNKVGGARHEAKLRRVIEHYTDLPVLGVVHQSPELEISERHLGLIPSTEERAATAIIQRLARAVRNQVDIDRLLTLAASAPKPKESRGLEDPPHPADVRIGYPRDRAFAFYYPGDLAALEAAGAELVPFDTLTDSGLPEVDGLFIGGGFPEMVMEELNANLSMRQAIRAFIEENGPVYAECGGLMYLARSIAFRGRSCEMVGVIPGEVVMHAQPPGRGYVRLRETPEHPWPDGSVSSPAEINGHEFHYSSLEALDGEPRYAYEVVRGTGIDGGHDGYIYRNLLACYSHQRNTGSNAWAKRFVEHVRRCRR